MVNSRKCDVLIVEDNPSDAFLIELGLGKDRPESISIRKVADGEEALNFLYNREQHIDAPRPAVVLLDLNLPKVDGRDVLRAIKGDPDLSRIPVVIFSTSESPHDVAASYQYGANSYIVKPKDLDDTLRIISLCRTYWLEVVRLETAERG
ncbi:MAG TPA: response regulator [Bryobacteraceae bacterium]|nr:response regulator [Bryobacteraceae bacterium]